MSWLPDWITGYDAENAARAQEADRQLREMGLSNYDAASDYVPENQRGQIQTAFDEELDARANSIIGGPLRGIGDVLGSVLKAVPWWIWIGAALGVFGWLGGFSWLAKITRGKLAR